MHLRFRNRIKFLLERLLLRGGWVRLLVIVLLLALVSIGAGLLVLAAGPGFDGPGDAIWWAFLRLTDPGYLGDDQGLLLRTVSVLLTVLGYVIFLGALIAIMTQWLNQTIRELESGLTPIVQDHHIVILGWTNRSATIVRELVLSEGRVRRFLHHHGARRLHVVVLAEEVTTVLRHELRERLGRLWRERQTVFRSGSPLRMEHLRRVDFMHAGAIILPGADFAAGGSAAADTRSIKALLSISNAARSEPRGKGAPDAVPLAVAEIFDARKVPVARRAYDGPIEIVASDAMIARLVAQNVRKRGLSQVYRELLTHRRGNAIYIREHPQFAHTPLQDLAPVFPDAVLLGVARPHGSSYSPLLNPPGGFVVEPDDRLVLLARSYDATTPAPERRPRPVERGTECTGSASASAHRRVLVLGWSRKVPALLEEFDSYTRDSFEIDLFSAVPKSRRKQRLERYGFRPERVAVRHLEGDYTVPTTLAAAEPTEYDNIVLLGSDWLRSGAESDARTVLGYLLLRELLPPQRARPDLLVELLDPANLALFHRRPGEVLISPSILSHVLAQVALRRELRAVFDELFGPGGAEIVFRPAAEYGVSGRPVGFDELQTVAALRGETALGVRTGRSGDPTIRLNPPRDQRWTLGADDDLILLTRGA